MSPEDAAVISQIVNQAVAPVIARQAEASVLLGRYDERLHAYTETITELQRDNKTQWQRIDEAKDQAKDAYNSAERANERAGEAHKRVDRLRNSAWGVVVLILSAAVTKVASLFGPPQA